MKCLTLFSIILASTTAMDHPRALHTFRDAYMLAQTYRHGVIGDKSVRRLEVEDACATETRILLQNVDYATAEASYSQNTDYFFETLDDSAMDKMCAATETSLHCLFRADQVDGFADAVSACSTAGGQPVTLDFSMRCSDTEYSFSFVFRNAHACMGASCSLQQELQEAEVFLNLLESEMEAGTDGMTCEFRVADDLMGDGSTGIRASLATLAAGASLFAAIVI